MAHWHLVCVCVCNLYSRIIPWHMQKQYRGTIVNANMNRVSHDLNKKYLCRSLVDIRQYTYNIHTCKYIRALAFRIVSCHVYQWNTQWFRCLFFFTNEKTVSIGKMCVWNVNRLVCSFLEGYWWGKGACGIDSFVCGVKSRQMHLLGTKLIA